MVKKMIAFILITFLISFINSEVVEWDECEAQNSCQISEVRINPCSSAPQPCKFKRGTSAAMEVDFVPNFDGTAGNFKGEIFWANPGGDIPFAGMNTDACAFTNCPLVQNQQQTYNFSLVTLRSYPVRTYNIKLKLTGDDKKECCFTTKIKLVR